MFNNFFFKIFIHIEYWHFLSVFVFVDSSKTAKIILKKFIIYWYRYWFLRFQNPLISRLLPVWDFVVGIIVRKAMFNPLMPDGLYKAPNFAYLWMVTFPLYLIQIIKFKHLEREYRLHNFLDKYYMSEVTILQAMGR